MIDKIGSINFRGHGVGVFGTMENPMFILGQINNALAHIGPGLTYSAGVQHDTFAHIDGSLISTQFVSEDVICQCLTPFDIERTEFRNCMVFLRYQTQLIGLSKTTSETMVAFSESLQKLGRQIADSWTAANMKPWNTMTKEAEDAEQQKAINSRLE